VPATPPPRPQPAQDAIAGSYAPQGGEGSYQMHDPAGIVRPVGYHQVHRALDDGFLFADKPTLQTYARDHAADPLDESRVDQWIDKHPILSFGTQEGIGFAKQASQLLSTPGPRPPASRWETELQLFGATPTHGLGEMHGAAGENLGELLTGEKLLSFLGRGGEIAKLGDKLKDVSGLARMIEKYPMIGKLMAIGASTAKTGTVAGAQTLQRTDDPRAAATTAGITALTGAPLQILGATGSAVNTIRKAGGEAAAEEAAAAAARETAASRETYAETARGAIRPHLEETNAARNVPQQEVMMNQPGGQPAVPTGRMAATATGKPAPAQINIDQVLKQTHDFTGAADRLTAINDEAYNQFDTATGGRFRQINGEVAAAQNAMRKGEQGAAQLYKQKLGEMDQLIDLTGGEMTPEMKAAAKSGFRQSYVLRDFGNLWDRNLNGVPGASQASQAQRGINGKGLLTDLQRAVKLYGRPQVEAALGLGRLDNLEEIAQQNMTAAKRVAFNRGVWEVMKRLHVGAVLGGAAGGVVGHWAEGAAVGAGAVGTGEVINAIKTNPKIGQNFLFALQSGATAERYGPFIATMIQKAMTDSSLQQQQQERQR
jgi:hypothetical protein